jgi:hypothetical protein
MLLKLIASILAIYVLFLSLLPAFVPVREKSSTGGYCESMQCCSKKPKHCEDRSGSCPMGTCSPFFGCEKIQVTLPAQNRLSFIISDEKKTQYAFEEQFLIDGIHPDFWHPPRLI